MANNIALFQSYVPILDEVYKEASKTAVLDGNPELAREGANAGELIIPMLEMEGLGDYSRNSGYVSGEVTLTHQTIPVNFDRGRMFSVDSQDDAESAALAFGMLAGEFLRTKVAPELDAFRFAAYAQEEGVSKAAGAALADGPAVIGALRAATNKMDEDEVPMEDRYLFITPSLFALVQDMDANKSREVLSRFTQVALVPQSRFYTALRQLSGAGEEKAGGYAKAAGGKDINFMVIHRAAVIQFPKHITPKVISPDLNQDADAWKFGYRQVGVVGVYGNKAAGIYLHHKA